MLFSLFNLSANPLFNLLFILIYLMVVVVSLTVHEWAHAWVALKRGDPTAKLDGRLTLNPLAHLDPLGTVSLCSLSFSPILPNIFKRSLLKLVKCQLPKYALIMIVLIPFHVSKQTIQSLDYAIMRISFNFSMYNVSVSEQM